MKPGTETESLELVLREPLRQTPEAHTIQQLNSAELVTR